MIPAPVIAAQFGVPVLAAAGWAGYGAWRLARRAVRR